MSKPPLPALLLVCVLLPGSRWGRCHSVCFLQIDLICISTHQPIGWRETQQETDILKARRPQNPQGQGQGSWSASSLPVPTPRGQWQSWPPAQMRRRRGGVDGRTAPTETNTPAPGLGPAHSSLSPGPFHPAWPSLTGALPGSFLNQGEIVPGAVAHAWAPNSSGGRGRRIASPRPASAIW